MDQSYTRNINTVCLRSSKVNYICLECILARDGWANYEPYCCYPRTIKADDNDTSSIPDLIDGEEIDLDEIDLDDK